MDMDIIDLLILLIDSLILLILHCIDFYIWIIDRISYCFSIDYIWFDLTDWFNGRIDWYDGSIDFLLCTDFFEIDVDWLSLVYWFACCLRRTGIPQDYRFTAVFDTNQAGHRLCGQCLIPTHAQAGFNSLSNAQETSSVHSRLHWLRTSYFKIRSHSSHILGRRLGFRSGNQKIYFWLLYIPRQYLGLVVWRPRHP